MQCSSCDLVHTGLGTPVIAQQPGEQHTQHGGAAHLQGEVPGGEGGVPGCDRVQPGSGQVEETRSAVDGAGARGQVSQGHEMEHVLM